MKRFFPFYVGKWLASVNVITEEANRVFGDKDRQRRGASWESVFLIIRKEKHFHKAFFFTLTRIEFSLTLFFLYSPNMEKWGK